jgi:hypothetical protein
MPLPRSAYRFRVQEPLKGHFGEVPISIRDLSEKGVQIEHKSPLPTGYSATLSYSIPGGTRQITLHGELRWTRSEADLTGATFYRSGVTIDENTEGLSSSLDLFIRKGIAKLDRGNRQAASVKPPSPEYPVDGGAADFRIAEHPEAARATVSGGVSPDDVRIVEQARERLAASFEESLRWYNRGRYALAEESVRQAVLDVRHREDVLAVWEYLGRTMTIATIAQAFERKSY